MGGESHRTGRADTAERYARLEAWARDTGTSLQDYRWVAQDNMPADDVPYVGRHVRCLRRSWVATGFRKWGLAMGTAAAAARRPQIAGREHE